MRWLGVALLVLTGWPAAAGAGARVVLMPVSNPSTRVAAAAEARKQLMLRLPRAGYDVVTGAPVERMLSKQRVRYLDSIRPDLLDALLQDLDATAAVFTSVLEYGDRTPSASVSLRLVAAGGRTLGTAIVGLTPEDVTGPVGLGRISSSGALLERAVARAVDMLPRPGETSRDDPPAPARTHPGEVWTYRAPALAGGQAHRVILLPIVNATPERAATRIVTDLLTARLRGLGVLQAVQPAELRAGLLAEGIHSLYTLDPDRMRALGKRLGTPLFLHGTLREYRTGSPATIELELAITDADSSRIVWMSRRRADGAEYRGFLELGTITSPAILADQVVAEMLEALSRARPPRARTEKPKS